MKSEMSVSLPRHSEQAQMLAAPCETTEGRRSVSQPVTPTSAPSSNSSFSTLATHHMMAQIEKQSKNLMTVCKLAVKTLVDKACFDIIDDSSEEVMNFVTILEHILSFRMKPHITWIGTEETRTMWDFVCVACASVRHNCLKNIESMENARSSRAKGRAWIHVALMEKRLSEYLTAGVRNSKLIKTMYDVGSVMLMEEVFLLPDMLLALNAIDFNFYLKEKKFDYGAYNVIDYTPYLSFVQSEKGAASDSLEYSMLAGVGPQTFLTTDTSSSQSDLIDMEHRYRNVCQQKSYLEELVGKKEVQLREATDRVAVLDDALRKAEDEHESERKQLNDIIIELQNTLQAVCHQRRKSSEIDMFPLWSVNVTTSGDMTDRSSIRSFGTSEGRSVEAESQSLQPMAGSLMSQDQLGLTSPGEHSDHHTDHHTDRPGHLPLHAAEGAACDDVDLSRSEAVVSPGGSQSSLDMCEDVADLGFQHPTA